MAKHEVGGDALIAGLRAAVDPIPQPQVHRDALLVGTQCGVRPTTVANSAVPPPPPAALRARWPGDSRDLDRLHRLLFDEPGARVGARPHPICEGPPSWGALADDIEVGWLRHRRGDGLAV